MSREPRLPLAEIEHAPKGAGYLTNHGAVILRRCFPRAACETWTAGTYEGRPVWTADFGADQFSLGNAFYTHLEQERSEAYFRDAAASDARVERHVPGLQSSLRAFASVFVGGKVRGRHGWCGPGVHVFPAGGHAATHGGVVHFDTEGLTPHHLAQRARAITLVAMLQPPESRGGLRVWDVLYDGHDDAFEGPLDAPSAIVTYGVGDVVAIDSYRLHQIQPFPGARDRISATLHLAEVDIDCWESWF